MPSARSGHRLQAGSSPREEALADRLKPSQQRALTQRALSLINTTRVSEAAEERQRANNAQPEEKRRAQRPSARWPIRCCSERGQWLYCRCVQFTGETSMHQRQHPSGGRGNDSKPKGG
jgi:hypothetical protein